MAIHSGVIEQPRLRTRGLGVLIGKILSKSFLVRSEKEFQVKHERNEAKRRARSGNVLNGEVCLAWGRKLL